MTSATVSVRSPCVMLPSAIASVEASVSSSFAARPRSCSRASLAAASTASPITVVDRLALVPWSYGVIEVSGGTHTDRKSTRLNSSHQLISYAVFCLKKKKKVKLESEIDMRVSYTIQYDCV